MGHDDSKRAIVERSGRLVQRTGADADNGGYARRQGGDAKLGNFLDVERTVFGIDEHPVVAGRGGKDRRGDSPQMMNAKPSAIFPAFSRCLVVLVVRAIGFLPVGFFSRQHARGRRSIRPGPSGLFSTVIAPDDGVVQAPKPLFEQAALSAC
jgi:hypothetical protein